MDRLNAGDPIEKLFIRDGRDHRLDDHAIARLARQKKCPIQRLSADVFDSRFDGNHQGVAIVVHDYKQATLGDIIEQPPSVILVLDHLKDPHNFGAICRTAEAFGVHHIMYPKNRAVQITPSVEKTAAGAMEQMVFIKQTNLRQALQTLRKNGVWVYGASSNQGQPIERAQLNHPMAIICGAEESGISPGLAPLIDAFIHIPMLGKTSSLNVSVATGIIIHSIVSK